MTYPGVRVGEGALQDLRVHAQLVQELEPHVLGRLRVVLVLGKGCVRLEHAFGGAHAERRHGAVRAHQHAALQVGAEPQRGLVQQGLRLRRDRGEGRHSQHANARDVRESFLDFAECRSDGLRRHGDGELAGGGGEDRVVHGRQDKRHQRGYRHAGGGGGGGFVCFFC